MEQSVEEMLVQDARRVGFSFARYKFVAKMFDGMNLVMEVGHGNGVYTKVVEQAVNRVDTYDLPEFDITTDTSWGPYDGVYMLDVFEHIAPELEYQMLDNLHACAPVCIIGTPSLRSQEYASARSKQQHINCKNGDDLKASLRKHWRHVFMFGMNDETLHTGYFGMTHYLLAMCVK